MLKNISLRHLIPMLFFGGSLLLIIIFYTFGIHEARNQAHALSFIHAQELIQEQKKQILDLITQQRQQDIAKEILYSSQHPAVENIILVDEHGIVQFASNNQYIGLSVKDTGIPYSPDVLADTFANDTTRIETNKNSNTLTGYASLLFESPSGKQQWVLLEVRTYDLLIGAIVTIATQPSEILSTLLLVLSLAAILILRQHLNRRLTPLLDAAERFSKGDKDARSGLTGNDEFAEISRAFDQMADRINKTLVQLEDAKDFSEKANSAKTHFLGNMSHEIRTPLAGVTGFIELMKDCALDPEARSYLRSAEAASRTLSALIEDLLDISRLEAGTITPGASVFCLNSLVQDLLDSNLQRTSTKGLFLKVQTSESDPIWIESDPRIFRQIMFNLLGNAIQYTEKGGVTISIASFPMDDHTCAIDLSFSDTGIGISKEDMPLVFNRFYRSADDQVRNTQGAGLGLTISKALAGLLGGSITVESTHGAGSVFTFNVEVAKAVAQDDYSALTNREQKPMNILLVDGSPLMQQLLTGILKRLGHTIFPCATAATAIRTMKDQLIYPDQIEKNLILMDLHLPDMEAIITANEIRGLDSRYQHIPIVALSTQGDIATREKCLNGPFDGFIPKPIDQRQLSDELFRLTRLNAVYTPEQSKS